MYNKSEAIEQDAMRDLDVYFDHGQISENDVALWMYEHQKLDVWGRAIVDYFVRHQYRDEYGRCISEKSFDLHFRFAPEVRLLKVLGRDIFKYSARQLFLLFYDCITPGFKSGTQPTGVFTWNTQWDAYEDKLIRRVFRKSRAETGMPEFLPRYAIRFVPKYSSLTRAGRRRLKKDECNGLSIFYRYFLSENSPYRMVCAYCAGDLKMTPELCRQREKASIEAGIFDSRFAYRFSGVEQLRKPGTGHDLRRLGERK